MTTQVQPKSRTVTANGINLHYLDWGAEGQPPLVLLHGLRGHANVWADVAESLCGGYHVYALDQRGRGDTDAARAATTPPTLSSPTCSASLTPSDWTSSCCSGIPWAAATAWPSPERIRSAWKSFALLTSGRA